MMSMPPGPPLVPADDDDALDREPRADEVDADAAAAEALGFADPEDAPISTDDDPDPEAPPTDGASES